MKFLTPDRMVQLENLSDESAFLAATEAWEDGLARYGAHLQRIGARLPGRMRRLVETVYLHDAEILEMSRGRQARFTIRLHPESDPSRLVSLDYSLVEEPTIDESALPESLRSSPVCWLYDELDVEEPREGAPTFRHDILLSNGWEVCLRFRKVVVRRPHSLIPARSRDAGIAAMPTLAALRDG